MAKKKLFLDDKAREVRRKTIDELKKQNIEIEDDDKIAGGASQPPQWLEVLPDGGGKRHANRPAPDFPGQ